MVLLKHPLTLVSNLIVCFKLDNIIILSLKNVQWIKNNRFFNLKSLFNNLLSSDLLKERRINNSKWSIKHKA